MKLTRISEKKHWFRGLTAYFLACCIFFSLPFSAVLAGPKGKALGHNLHGRGSVNPVGIITGTGGGSIKATILNKGIGVGSQQVTGTVGATNPGTKGHSAIFAGNKMFLGQPDSDIIVKIGVLAANKSGINKVNNKNKIHPSGGGLILAAGDVFSKAIPNLGSLSAPVVHGNQNDNPGRGHGKGRWGNGENPAGGVDFNPGGGPDKLGEAGIGEKGWGTGNKGRGVGNTWVGNQGHGEGGGMAGAYKCKCQCKFKGNYKCQCQCQGCCDCEPEPPDPPDPPDPPEGKKAAPLDEQVIPELAGCPALLEAASLELGITKEVIQVSIGAGLAANSNIQPCGTLSQLVDAAGILRDEGGIRMAAINEVFNELAPVDAPFTAAMGASIVTALAGHVDDGTQYAIVVEYIDAFVEYIRILEAEMDSPVGDAVDFVMEKYGVDIMENDNSNIAVFVALRLASLETFGG